MKYYLKNLKENTVTYLGESEDMYGVTRKLRAACRVEHHYYRKDGRCWLVNNPQSGESNLLENYNQTGKDLQLAVVHEDYYVDPHGVLWPNHTYGWAIRPYLVVDENGRHISLDVVKDWLERYQDKRKFCSPYLRFSGSWRRGWRLPWCSMLHSDLRNLSDTAGREDVMEFAGAHTANKLMNRRKADVRLKSDADNWPNQPRRSWKRQKCKRQWQKNKPRHRDQLAEKPVYEPASIETLSAEIVGNSDLIFLSKGE